MHCQDGNELCTITIAFYCRFSVHKRIMRQIIKEMFIPNIPQNSNRFLCKFSSVFRSSNSFFFLVLSIVSTNCYYPQNSNVVFCAIFSEMTHFESFSSEENLVLICDLGLNRTIKMDGMHLQSNIMQSIKQFYSL